MHLETPQLPRETRIAMFRNVGRHGGRSCRDPRLRRREASYRLPLRCADSFLGSEATRKRGFRQDHRPVNAAAGVDGHGNAAGCRRGRLDPPIAWSTPTAKHTSAPLARRLRHDVSTKRPLWFALAAAISIPRLSLNRATPRWPG